MDSGLYKFSKLKKGGILSSITDTTLRDLLRQILENGVKFEGCEFEVDDYEVEDQPQQIQLVIPSQPKVIFDPLEVKNWAIEKWDLYKIQTNKKEVIDHLKKAPHYGLSEEEWEAHKDRFKDIDDDRLLDLLNTIIAARETGESVVVVLPKEVEDPEKELLHNTINNLRNEITRMETDILNITQQCDESKTRLEDEKNSLENKLNQAQELKVQLEQEKTNLQNQLTQTQEQKNVIEQQKTDKEAQITQLQNSIASLTAEKQQIQDTLNQCLTDKTQLEADKRQIQQQLKQCQDAQKDLVKQKGDKEGEITVIQGTINSLTLEKQEIQNKLTECEKQIQRLLQAQATCDQINTAKIKELQAKIDQLSRVKTENQNKIRDLNSQLTTQRNNLSKARTDLTNCKADINKKKEEINRLKEELRQKQTQIDARPTQGAISDLQAKLDAKTKELADKVKDLETKSTELAAKEKELADAQKSCEDQKKQWEAKKQQLERDLETNKEAKEEFEQKLNDERRNYLNKVDELNKLKEECDELKEEKAQLEEDYRAKVRELDVCRVDRDTRKEAQSKEDCEVLKDIISTPYRYDLKERENGWNAFMDLALEIYKHANKRAIGQMALKNLESDAELQQMWHMNHMVFKNYIPVLKEAYDVFSMDGWDKYQKWLSEGGQKNGHVDDIIKAVNNWKSSINEASVLAVKNVLDEAFYVAYTTMTELNERIGESTMLQSYFADVFPGNIPVAYEKVFGDPNKAIVRKRFMDEVECSDQGRKSITEFINDLKRETKLGEKTQSIRPAAAAVTPEEPKEVVPEHPTRFARSIDEAKYSGVLLDTIDIKWPYANPLFMFEDAYNVTRHLEDPTYRWTYDGRSYTLKDKPKISVGLQFWKYTYDKRLPSGNYYKCIWFKFRTKDYSSSDGTHWQYANYLIKSDLKRVEMKEQFNYLIENISKLTIPDTIINGIKDGSITLKLTHKSFKFIFNEVLESPPYDKILTITETVSFGTGNNELHWPEDKISDLLKYLFIFSALRVTPQYIGRDSSDDYSMYQFVTEWSHPVNTNLRNERLLNKFNEVLAGWQSTTINLELGWLFNSIKERIQYDGDIPLPSTVPQTSQTAVFATLYRWIYGHISGKKKYDHPYDWGTGHMYYLFHRMKEA